MPTDRDAYRLEASSERKAMLADVLAGQIYTWANIPLRKNAGDGVAPHDEQYPPAMIKAFQDLCRAGLVNGEYVTGRGYRAATDWGLKGSTP
jgi:hypothetical protein